MNSNTTSQCFKSSIINPGEGGKETKYTNHMLCYLLPRNNLKGMSCLKSPFFLILGNNFLLGKVMYVLLIFWYFGTQM